MRRLVTAVVMLGAMLGGAAGGGVAQGKGRAAESSGTAQAATRYFEVTLLLRSPGAAGQEEQVQRMTTDLAVVQDQPALSSGRLRVTSQVPVVRQNGRTYLDIGTKLDCNDVRIEGGALSMQVVLETTSVRGMVTTLDKDGRSLEEPLFTMRTLDQRVRLPLGKPTVIFDAKNMDAGRLQPQALSGGGAAAGSPPAPAEMQVEMTARELP